MELSEKYGLMVDPDALISDITVGMQQRTEILKMLYRDNEVLIFDEPTAVLTPQEIDELMKIMKNLAKEGKSILFITHKLNEIMEVADRCTILRKGKYIGTVNISETSKEELSRMMVGRNVSFSVNKKPSKPGDTVLKVEHMTVPSKVHGNNAVKDVSFNVRKGEIVCIAGIDGNGQSEFVQGLTGLEKVSGGKILFNGQDITKASIRDRSKMGMSHIPEDRHKHGLVLDYSIEQNMVLQRYWQPKFESFGFIKSKAVREYAERLIEQYDVRSGQGPVTITRSMSGGNQQKAIIAREIDKDPDLLVAVQLPVVLMSEPSNTFTASSLHSATREKPFFWFLWNWMRLWMFPTVFLLCTKESWSASWIRKPFLSKNSVSTWQVQNGIRFPKKYKREVRKA